MVHNTLATTYCLLIKKDDSFYILMKGFCNITLKHIAATQAGKILLDNISFTLQAGEHLAIFGASGSGKSLLAKAIKGELFHSGTINFTRDQQPVKPIIAYVPAVYTIKNLANQSNFYYQQRFNTSDAADAATLKDTLLLVGNEKQIEHWLKKFHLQHRSQTPLIQLSNGELKKMQLISQLLTNPDIIILDKVFIGLDMQSRKVLHGIINELAANGISIILITDSHELPACITHFAEMSNAAIVNYAPIGQLGFMHAPPIAIFDGEIPVLKKVYHIGPLINMKNVIIRYGDTTILNNINWQVNNGECWLIKGHNGAGKSTLLSLINGDNPQAYSQDIYLFGKKRGSGESIWDIKKKIGFVSPELQNFFDKTTSVFQTIASGFFDTIGLFKKPNNEQTEKVNKWLSLFSLTGKAQKPLSSLPGGEQRLVLIARALIKDPLLLALDEPCQGLDDDQCKQVISLLEKVHENTCMPILFISHYETEVPSCVQHILELQKGVATIYKKSMVKTNGKYVKENQPIGSERLLWSKRVLENYKSPIASST